MNSASGAQAIAVFAGVSFSYDGSPVLEDVSLTLHRGESTCVVGPNGGGKTTFVKLLLGLLKPVSGSISVFGAAPEEARGRIGYLPQSSRLDPLFPVTVLDVVLMGRLHPRSLGRYNRSDREAALQALAEVGLADERGRRFADLSGGQRQRALIARALCGAPEALVLDEPTSNIDPRAAARLTDLLRELSTRLTIVMISHDVGYVSSFFSRVLCVNRRVVTHPTSEVTHSMLGDLYGGEYRAVLHDHRVAEE